MNITLSTETFNRMNDFRASAFSEQIDDAKWRSDTANLLKLKFTGEITDELRSKQIYKTLTELLGAIGSRETGASEAQVDMINSVIQNLNGLCAGTFPLEKKRLIDRTIVARTLELVDEIIGAGAVDENVHTVNVSSDNSTGQNANKGWHTRMPKGFSETLAAIKENPGAGDCLLFSVMDAEADKTSTFEETAAFRRELMTFIKKESAQYTEEKGSSDYIHLKGYPNDPLAVEEFIDCEEKYAIGRRQLPTAFLPFLAAKLNRPIVLVQHRYNNPSNGPETVVYNKDLAGNTFARKDPLTIFFTGKPDSIDKATGKVTLGSGHFRAAKLKPEKLKELGFAN